MVQRALLSLLLLSASQAVLAAGVSPASDKPASGLLFVVTGEKGTLADIAKGGARPLFEHGVSQIADGASGKGLSMVDDLTLAWPAPGNILAQRGTLSFFFRARTPVGEAQFPIFRIGAADGTSWDMTFLRIDWNGHGFDAFVTDNNLSRVRVSWRMPATLAAEAWTHIAFAWDERQGVALFVDGRKVAEQKTATDLDMGLFGFGPFQRVISPQKVESAYNYMRSGDLDEVRIYDHALDPEQIAAIARKQAVSVAAALPRDLNDAATRREWSFRYGWDHIAGPTDYGSGKIIAIRKVEFTDARDQKEKAFRGSDGIRETTWPGVYNRSRLPGRNDYFTLPDWNVYATGGQAFTLTLPSEPWNHLEIIGAAHGTLSLESGSRQSIILRRPAGVLRSSTQLAADQGGGGQLIFRNAVQETPIQEFAAYRFSPIDQIPQGLVHLDYKVDPAAGPEGYASLLPLMDHIRGRYPNDEQSTVVALPAGAPVIVRSGTADAGVPGALPLVHILIPPTFRDQLPGGTPRRFSYGWENMDAGLDGVALHLPPLDLSPDKDGLVPLNIRLHDPIWPDRDLIDVIVRLNPRMPQTLWLDSRDRILRPQDGIALSISAPGAGLNAGRLAGTTVSLVFKPTEVARVEHVADRLEQARDELATFIEEQPSTRLYPAWDRFERDISDVLTVDPHNERARQLWVEKNPEQPYGVDDTPSPPPGIPAWAFYQTQDLSLYRRFVDWWIDHRQIADGEFGGGLSDDTDLVNLWVGLGLMGVEADRVRRSQRAVLDATFANGMWNHGLSTIQADQLHSYEEGINTLGQAMLLSWGDPTEIERAMAVARNYPRLIETNPAGHSHFVSAWFSGSRITREGYLGWQYPYSFLITHPGLLLVDYNGAPRVRSTIVKALDGWLAHGVQDTSGRWTYPQDIEWSTDRGRGSGVDSAAHDFWAAWKWTGDAKYLRPLEPFGLTGESLPMLFSLNADALTQLPGGEALARKIASGEDGTSNHSFDPNLGTVGADRAVSFVRWQQTGDDHILSSLFEEEVRRTRQRFYVLTSAEFWSDRVSVPSELLQRSRMGGVAHLRNHYYPGNLVSWDFEAPDTAEKVGIQIPKGDPDRFRVIAYNLSDSPIRATMVGGMLTPGLWRMSGAPKTSADHPADASALFKMVRLEHGLGTPLIFPPHRTVVFDFALEKRGDDPASRPDIGISAYDLTRRGSSLFVTVHSLGAKPTGAGTVSVADGQGHILDEVRFASLDAPADLLPRTLNVHLKLPPIRPGATLHVVAKLNGNPQEVTMANNTADLVSPTANARPSR